MRRSRIGYKVLHFVSQYKETNVTWFVCCMSASSVIGPFASAMTVY